LEKIESLINYLIDFISHYKPQLGTRVWSSCFFLIRRFLKDYGSIESGKTDGEMVMGIGEDWRDRKD
jgi:hypothetical protein